MKVGITGTREGANHDQLDHIVRVLLKIRNEAERLGIQPEFHHGDCVGVDQESAELAYYGGFKIVCHPPSSDYLRAFVKAHEYRTPMGYLQRDRAIVDSVDALIVVPLYDVRTKGSGTWYTHDYAIKQGKPVIMIPRIVD